MRPCLAYSRLSLDRLPSLLDHCRSLLDRFRSLFAHFRPLLDRFRSLFDHFRSLLDHFRSLRDPFQAKDDSATPDAYLTSVFYQGYWGASQVPWNALLVDFAYFLHIFSCVFNHTTINTVFVRTMYMLLIW